MYWKYASIIMFINTVGCFNIDTNFPILFVDPELKENRDTKSYFGYSVVINPSSDTNPAGWIRIGAPKASNDSQKRLDIGIVYDCGMNGCEAIVLPKSPQTQHLEKINHGWIGGTMDISYECDRMVICAFRRYYIFDSKSWTDYRTLGTCYLSTLNSTEFENMDPLLDIERTVTGRFYLYGQGQAGFSAHFSKHHGKFIDLVLGAPGVYNWAGSTIKVRYENIDSPPVNRRRSTMEMSKTVDIPNHSNTKADNILFGYSVTSGYFHKDNKLLYAAGAPRGNEYKGKVEIFEFDGSRSIITRDIKQGTEFGEYFGASIASGKINKDNLDDLIVGAPHFGGKSYSEGKAYVFLGGKGDLKMHTVLTGKSKNSQFGTAIMCLGDIDSNGYGDIAISAPYEDDDKGAVYIYGGSDSGVDKTPRQVIFGNEIASQILGFGITISKAIDMDKNGYKDFAVGAYLSGHAVLLRSRPIVVIHYDFFAVPRVLKLGSTDFLLKVCFSYSIFNEDTVDISYNISVVGRSNILGRKKVTKNITITKGNRTCDTINVTLEASDSVKFPTKALFSYDLNYDSTAKGLTYISEKVQERNDMLCIRCPILDRYRSDERYKDIDIPFKRDCGDDDICKSNLSISINFPELGKNMPFVLGSKNSLEVEIILRNSGENAYDTELQIILPEVSFRQIEPRCKPIFTNGSAISCIIDDPVKQNASKIVHLDLNFENNLYKLTSAKVLQILFRITTTSENTNNFVRRTLTLSREADIRIFGNSEQQNNFFGSSNTTTSAVTHTYKVQKTGVSPLENITVEIQIPHIYVSSQNEFVFIELYEPVSLLGSQPRICKSEIAYIMNEQPQTGEHLFDNMNMRSKREVVEVFKNLSTHEKEDIKINEKEIEVTPNKTLYLNSSSEDVKWTAIKCEFDMSEESLASIEIKMLFNISVFSGTMEHKDTILLSTRGEVKIHGLTESENNVTRSIIITTAFVNDALKKEKIALWIIIVSAIAGILLLALLIFVLIKVRFFQRVKREKLKHMKALANIKIFSSNMTRDKYDGMNTPKEKIFIQFSLN